MKNRWWLAVLASVVVGSATLAAVPAPAAADGACDGTKEKPCPLQVWMRNNLGAALANGVNEDLAKSFEKAAALNPDPSWATKPDGTGWVDITKAGAKAARAGDTAGAKAACKAATRGSSGAGAAFWARIRSDPASQVMHMRVGAWPRSRRAGLRPLALSGCDGTKPALLSPHTASLPTNGSVAPLCCRSET